MKDLHLKYKNETGLSVVKEIEVESADFIPNRLVVQTKDIDYPINPEGWENPKLVLPAKEYVEWLESQLEINIS